MGHEYGCDKPPYEVFPSVFGQQGYLVEADGEVADMGFYVALVTLQVEARARPPYYSLCRPHNQSVEGIQEPRDDSEVSRH